MARCVSCGEEAPRPVWAIYADPALERKHQTPFPLHAACFNQSETITAREWVPLREAGDRHVVLRTSGDAEQASALVEIENYPRYQKVEAPNG